MNLNEHANKIEKAALTVCSVVNAYMDVSWIIFADHR